jgi:hypothetical protein
MIYALHVLLAASHVSPRTAQVTWKKAFFMVVPNKATATMIATAIRPTSNTYSTDVAPCSFRVKLAHLLWICDSPELSTTIALTIRPVMKALISTQVRIPED